jgi:hypothetical protein
MTMNVVDPTESISKIDTILGWFKAEAVRASFSNRWSLAASEARLSGSTLIATSRDNFMSRAR